MGAIWVERKPSYGSQLELNLILDLFNPLLCILWDGEMYLLCKIFQFKSREWVCILDSHKFCKLSFGYTLKPWNSKSQELLALGERIGNVNTGLSEEIVARQLKTRVYLSATNYINLEEPASKDQEPGSCIICQVIEAIAFQTTPPPPQKKQQKNRSVPYIVELLTLVHSFGICRKIIGIMRRLELLIVITNTMQNAWRSGSLLRMSAPSANLKH